MSYCVKTIHEGLTMWPLVQCLPSTQKVLNLITSIV